MPHAPMRLGLFIQIEDPKMWLVVSGALAAARQQKARLVVYAGPTEAGHQTLDRRVIETCYNFSRQTHQGAILAFALKVAVTGVDLYLVGVILMAVGAVAFVAGLFTAKYISVEMMGVHGTHNSGQTAAISIGLMQARHCPFQNQHAEGCS